MEFGYEENLDKNFSKALNLCVEDSISRKKLLELLENGNIPEKQFAAIELPSVNDVNEAKILISNLTGCDGKIREAVAFKLSEIIESDESAEMFSAYPLIFAKATIDINSNICRMIIDVLRFFKTNNDFSNIYASQINEYINEALVELDNFIFRDKKYTINKQLFKLYWCMEGLNLFYSYLKIEDLENILEKCSEISEYTIREKVAMVLKNDIKSEKLSKLKQKLKSDSNYYVKNT